MECPNGNWLRSLDKRYSRPGKTDDNYSMIALHWKRGRKEAAFGMSCWCTVSLSGFHGKGRRTVPSYESPWWEVLAGWLWKCKYCLLKFWWHSSLVSVFHLEYNNNNEEMIPSSFVVEQRWEPCWAACTPRIYPANAVWVLTTTWKNHPAFPSVPAITHTREKDLVWDLLRLLLNRVEQLSAEKRAGVHPKQVCVVSGMGKSVREPHPRRWGSLKTPQSSSGESQL